MTHDLHHETHKETHDEAHDVSAHVDAARLLDSIEALATFGARSDGGVDRPALSEEDLQARAYLIKRAQSLGCTVLTDECANLFIRRAGTEDLPPVMTGSHIDTQPTGGKLDGCYGVLAGIECIAALDDASVRTLRPLEVAVWTNEEGTRFQPGAMGSSAFVEPQLIERYRRASDASGVTLANALDGHRRRFPALGKRNAADAVHAFIELHIEQGPLLELAGVPLGIVNGIQGVRWYEITCEGMPAHAGTTPMHARRDAMTLAVAVRAEIDAFSAALGQADTRVTFGRWSVQPNSINTIPSSVTFTVDFRHPDADVLTAFDDRLAHCAKRHGVGLERLLSHAPTRFDERLIAQMSNACEALGAPTLPLTSGAFHDAMHLATRCPTAMLFVPSRDGVSHNPREATDDEHLLLGARALARCLATLCNLR